MSVWLGERRNVAGLVGAVNLASLCGCQPVPAVTQVCSLAAPVGRSGTPLQVTGLDISTDGQTIVAALEDGTSRAWRVGPNGSADEIASLAPEKRQRKDVAVLGRQICVSADGRIVAIASAVDAKANQTGQQEAAAGFVRILGSLQAKQSTSGNTTRADRLNRNRTGRNGRCGQGRCIRPVSAH